MKVNLRLGLVLGVAALALVACKDDGEDTKAAKSDKPKDQFSSTFAEAFSAKSTAEPIDPKSGDADAKKKSGNPVDF